MDYFGSIKKHQPKEEDQWINPDNYYDANSSPQILAQWKYMMGRMEVAVQNMGSKEPPT